MRLNRVTVLLLIAMSCVTAQAMAESGSAFGSDCNAWVSAVHGARARPALELLVDEKASGKYKPPDLERVRVIAEDLYKRDASFQDDFPTMEEFVRWSVEDNAMQSLDYAEQYQYRIIITSNRFLVVSSNLMERHDHVYHAVAGSKEGRAYNVVAVNYGLGGVVRSTWSGGVAEYTDILEYGCVSGSDMAALEVIWKIVSGKNGDALWQSLCASGGRLQVGAKGLGVKITNDVLESREVVRIESGSDDGKGVEVLMIDKTDGRMLLLKESRNVEGVQRVRCGDFVSVNGSNALYPLTIIEEGFDAAGTPVMIRVLTVRSVVSLSDDELRDVDWGLLKAGPSASEKR